MTSSPTERERAKRLLTQAVDTASIPEVLEILAEILHEDAVASRNDGFPLLAEHSTEVAKDLEQAHGRYA